jgi:glycosyltransferase involved in cell wall biosynthesis
VVRSLNATIVAGEDDRKALERLSGRESIHVVPNGVDRPSLPDFTRESGRPTVALTGTLSYYANVDAAVYFARDVWPAIQNRFADSRLVIAGRNPSRRVLALDELPGVEVRADVGDMSRVIEESWIAVAPMRCGAGIKNKILEAWAVGRPAVITPIAANGLHLNAGMKSLVVSGDTAFSTRVASLIEDRELRHRLGREAHTLAGSRHSWERSARAVSMLLDSVARTGGHAQK